MGRAPRSATGNIMYHVVNRANGRLPIFNKPGDYTAFEEILEEAQEKCPMRILAYCLMPNHWHLVLWPHADGDLSQFMRWVTLTHTQRWHAHYHSVGSGHLYQGRYKAFPMQDDDHFLNVCRYVERNALRAHLVSHAQEWRWSSGWRKVYGTPSEQSLLEPWPRIPPGDYISWLNESYNQEPSELGSIRSSMKKSAPYGTGEWAQAISQKLGLNSTMRPQGRPRKST